MAALAVFTEHGGRVDAARARFGGADWIDLSTGIAPWAYTVEGVPLGLDRLPEPAAIAALEAVAAAAFGVDPGSVVAVPGTDLAMRLLAGLVEAERPAVVAPGYAGHRAAWPEALEVTEAFGARPSTGSGRTGEEATNRVHASAPFLPDPVCAELVEAPVQRALVDRDLLVLASPGNPSGDVVDPARLPPLLGHMTVVLDQAYADPDPCPPLDDRLIVLRSFGKFYGLPGLRLGFVVAGPTIAGRLRARLGDWPVSSAAVAIGTAAYRDAAWRDAQAARIDTMARRLDTVLDRAGLFVRGRAPLFRLVETDDAARLFEQLARRAILTRPFADQPGWLRIGLPCDEVAVDRLSSALEDAR